MTEFHRSSDPKTLVEAVRAQRIARKMPLRQFAAAIGRSMYTISKWENGHTNPRSSTRRLLVDWLGFDPEAVQNSQDTQARSAQLRLRHPEAHEAGRDEWRVGHIVAYDDGFRGTVGRA